MIISPINHAGFYGPLTSESPATTPDENILQPEEEISVLPGIEESEQVATVEDGTEPETEVKGVLRLLQAGHFKGVADVRLRINFHEEIAAMEAQKAARVMSEGITAISDTVTSEIDGYLNQGMDETTASLVTEARDAFAAELTSIVGDDPSQVPTHGLVSQIRAAFDGFVASVTATSETTPEELVEGPADETAAISMTEAAVVDEGVTEVEVTPPVENDAGLSLEEFIAALTATFETALQELESSLADIQVLPPLSEPSGNGKAYDKFVALYNDLRGGQAAQSSIEVIS